MKLAILFKIYALDAFLLNGVWELYFLKYIVTFDRILCFFYIKTATLFSLYKKVVDI